jgi:transcriptional regulator with XRE-family HTH domain
VVFSAAVRRTTRAPHLAEEFGRRVRLYREALPDEDGRKVSQERLAERCGLHRTYVGHIERGEVDPALYSIVKIAAGLGIDPSELVRGLKP